MISVGSYKSRKGRMIPSRRRALDELWLDYGISEPGPVDPDVLFGRSAACHLEIGFGMGDALLETARRHPENNYLGVEVYLPGIGQLLLGISASGLANVRIARGDAMEILDRLPTAALERVSLFFPDPWPKTRHHKRRLVQPPFVEKLRRVLAPGGLFHAATDWDHYAHQIRATMEGAAAFRNRSGPGRFYPGPVERPLTKFEKRGLKRGHQVRDLLFERI
ncbi:MAG: tRNA (guanosine(46)-N7)-methyltransferase TrmB [Desulfurivibrionaceae bacterium]|nr:tRNA (guanosine(46)-N7)-methyltransferase TrmB [Desulfurivibrionaceae bacterium]